MKTVAVIQARMGSTRLPGKVLLDLAGEPMLVRVVRRVCRAKRLDQIVVATTDEPADGPIAECCQAHGWPCFRGSRDDVLDRYYRAAQQFAADVVLRVTADCPLIDPGLVDRVVEEFFARQPQAHYASNSMPVKTYPRGLDCEAIRFDALERAWREDRNPDWREHVTPYIYRHPELFHLHSVAGSADFSAMRWTVDTPEDFALARLIYGHFGHDRFSWLDVLEVLNKHPDWSQLNARVKQKVC